MPAGLKVSFPDREEAVSTNTGWSVELDHGLPAERCHSLQRTMAVVSDFVLSRQMSESRAAAGVCLCGS